MKAKKFFRTLLIIFLHMVIAGLIAWLSWCAAEVLYELVPRWSFKSYIGPCIALPCVAIYWVKKAVKRLESK